MTSSNQTENIYISELKSLLKDKFFMLLLGISVAIVLMSTVYSIVKPKTNGDLASGISSESTTLTQAPTPADDSPTYEDTSDIAGLEPVEGTTVNTETTPTAPKSLFQTLKDKAKEVFSPVSVSPSPALQETVDEAETGSNPQKGQTYTVQEGDNLWMIAEKVYSSGYNFVDIASANNIGNPDYIEIGQKIMIPSVTPRESTVGDITPQAAMTKSEASVPATHTVVEGDSLWVIAQKQYNDPYQWTRIAELNPTVTNPDFIMPGQVLKLK